MFGHGLFKRESRWRNYQRTWRWMGGRQIWQMVCGTLNIKNEKKKAVLKVIYLIVTCLFSHQRMRLHYGDWHEEREELLSLISPLSPLSLLSPIAVLQTRIFCDESGKSEQSADTERVHVKTGICLGLQVLLTFQYSYLTITVKTCCGSRSQSKHSQLCGQPEEPPFQH